MWKAIKIKGRNPFEVLDELIGKSKCTADLRIAVYDLEERHIVMACGDKRFADKLELTDEAASQFSRCSKGKFAVLAYNLADETVVMLESEREIGAICAILCCLAEAGLHSAPTAKTSSSRSKCVDHEPKFGNPCGCHDDDDLEYLEDTAYRDDDSGAYTPVSDGMGILGRLSSVLD